MFSRPHLRSLLAVSAALLLAASAASAQQVLKNLKNNQISLDGFGQYTSTVSGNGISVRATHSVGGAAYFTHSEHWWLGWQGGYAYTRYTNYYTGQVYGRQANMHEFSGDYYVHGPTVIVQPFAAAGVSAVIFSPSLNGGQNVPWQPRPGLNFSVGANVPLLTGHLGFQVLYRGVEYKTPDFRQPKLSSNTWRLTSEPMAGVYVRF